MIQWFIWFKKKGWLKFQVVDMYEVLFNRMNKKCEVKKIKDANHQLISITIYLLICIRIILMMKFFTNNLWINLYWTV